MNKLVSVICTVKNGEETISATIETILNQTYNNWEFVIVDDGSTDNTADIINNYRKKDKRIRYIHTKGIGRSQALNLAIKSSRGEFVANLDADDLMHPSKIEKQIDFMEKNESCFLVGTRTQLVYEDKKVKWETNNISSISVIDYKILIRNTIPHSSVMMHKEKLQKIGGYNITRKTQVDYELWLRAFCEGQKMYLIEDKLAAKRIHKGQSFENKKRLNYITNAMKLQIKYIWKLKKYVYLIPIPILKFFIAMLPFSVRRKIIKF